MATLFYVWVTVSDPTFVEPLCSKLIRRGFSVGPISRTPVTQWDGIVGAVIGLAVSCEPAPEAQEHNVRGVYDEVVDVIKQVEGKYLSAVVVEATSCMWNSGNVRVDDEKKLADIAARKLN